MVDSFLFFNITVFIFNSLHFDHRFFNFSKPSLKASFRKVLKIGKDLTSGTWTSGFSCYEIENSRRWPYAIDTPQVHGMTLSSEANMDIMIFSNKGKKIKLFDFADCRNEISFDNEAPYVRCSAYRPITVYY